MLKTETIVANYNISGRIARKIVSELNAINSFVYLEKDNRCINAKSILGLLSLDIQIGDVIKVIINNDNDEDDIDVSKVLKLFS